MSEYLIYILIGAFVLFFIIAIGIATGSYSKFVEVYNKYSDQSGSGYTTALEFARRVSMTRLGSRLRIGKVDGRFKDAYDPSQNVVFLSEATINSASISALSVVAHELGHALQKNNNDKRLDRITKLKKFMKPMGFLIFPLFILGVVIYFIAPEMSLLGIALCGISAVLFFTAVWLKISLLAVEKDASKKGLKLLEETDVLMDYELGQAKEVLDAAYMTYVGDFFRLLFSWTFIVKASY